MKRHLLCYSLLMLLLLPLYGCGSAAPSAALSGIVFERGHGSAWGNQLYLEVCPEEIVVARYIPEGSTELQTAEKIPITQTQWQRLEAQLQEMTLEKERVSWWQQLLGKKKLDGGEYRKLTLVYGDAQVACRWPDDGAELEALLEYLVGEVTQ